MTKIKPSHKPRKPKAKRVSIKAWGVYDREGLWPDLPKYVVPWRRTALAFARTECLDPVVRRVTISYTLPQPTKKARRKP